MSPEEKKSNTSISAKAYQHIRLNSSIFMVSFFNVPTRGNIYRDDDWVFLKRLLIVLQGHQSPDEVIKRRPGSTYMCKKKDFKNQVKHDANGT